MRKILGSLILMALVVAFGIDSLQAGSPTGPASASHVVRSYSTDQFKRAYVGGESAIVLVMGDGSTDLDVYIYDEYGTLVGKDDDTTDRCVVRWTPSYTGVFTIRVINRGSLPNAYRIMTN